MRFVNPYDGINFASTPKVKAISHEHISSTEQLKSAYDRGIRWFAPVWYQPAVPRYPMTGWSYEYLDYTNTNMDDFTTEMVSRYGSGSLSNFEDKDGNTVNVADLPNVPNAEHPKFAWDKHAATPSIIQHFNVLGSLWPEVGHDVGAERMAKIQAHPLWDLNDINEKFTSDLLYAGKVFGTINHNKSKDTAIRFLETCPSIFKAIEINNNGSRLADNQAYRDLFDTLLTMGYRIWGTSVQDWQGDYRHSEVQYDRGCNVLLIPEYNSMTVSQKSEAGLDAYISGCYYSSAFGNSAITELSIIGDSVKVSFDHSATRLYAITNKGKYQSSGSSIVYKIPKGATYIRFEAYFDGDQNALDFIFTNPIFIEDNESDDIAQKLILDII